MDRLRPFPPRPAQPAPPEVAGMKFSELIGALSHALDITEGQPKGHCIRVCWIGTHIGMALGLPVPALRDLYYTLLLKDLGCSSNAARICELYLTDDLAFKRDFKTVGTGLPDVLRFVFTHTGLNAGLAGRLRSVVNILRNGPRITDDLIRTIVQEVLGHVREGRVHAASCGSVGRPPVTVRGGEWRRKGRRRTANKEESGGVLPPGTAFLAVLPLGDRKIA